jgi:hypothetical protein
LRLINQDRRVGAVWQREGGPRLIRHLLHGPAQSGLIVPSAVRGCDVPRLLERFIPALLQRGGERLRADIIRYGNFARIWPGATLTRLDEAALAMGDGA